TRGIRDDLAAAIVQRQRRGTEDFQRGFEHLGTTDTGTDRAVLRHRRRTTPCHHTLANRLAGGLRRARRQRGRRRLHRGGGGGGGGQHLADIGAAGRRLTARGVIEVAFRRRWTIVRQQLETFHAIAHQVVLGGLARR